MRFSYFFLLSLFFIPAITKADYQTVSVGNTIELGEFVYDDDYTATTTLCTIKINDPLNINKVNDVSMTANANGWHHYEYEVNTGETEGVWPAVMTCGSALNGDLIKVDKSFKVGPSLSSIEATLTTASSSLAAVINANTDQKVETASSSLLSYILSIPINVWNYSSRTLSGFGTLVADVWTNATRTLTGAGLDTGSLATASDVSSISGASSWSTSLSDYSSVQTGKTYRAKITILNSQSIPTNPLSTPTVSLYDAERNLVASGISMTSVGTGVYEYTYSVPSGAAQGVWETVVTTTVEVGKTITNNDYWIVAGSPAQVIINSVDVTGAPTISANLTVTNEGLAGYEYHYEWCVVSSINNSCGGGDDVYHGTGAKFINPAEDWNTNLTATVPTAGSYYFKTIVYFGTESSGSSRTFTITSTESTSGGSSGGGGGGGSSSSTSTNTNACIGADLNGDGKVGNVDFSILLAFWKTKAPFTNKCVDINKDNQVNPIDFSILLSQWGFAGKEYGTK